ncbi:MAG: hypothetical protein WCG68_05695, partial [Actinomycetes bacterium]
ATLNDADGFVANFWRALIAAPDEVAQHLDWPVNECVPAGTMIATPSGGIPVESITSGMTVLGERDGRIVPTVVLATKQSQASEFYAIGPLRVTSNHPVWTAEYGYQEARNLTSGLHIGVLNWSVDEIDIKMLYCQHEHTTLGNLHTDRPANQQGSLCGRDIPRQAAIQRTCITGGDRRKNTSRLLDTLTSFARSSANLSSNRGWSGFRLAGCRTEVDSVLSAKQRPYQSNRWGRWNTGIRSDIGIASEAFPRPQGRAISSWAHWGNEGQEAYTGSGGEDTDGWNRKSHARKPWAENISRPQRNIAFGRTKSKTLRIPHGQVVIGSAQTEDSRYDHESEASDLRGNGRGILLSDRSSTQPGRERSLGQSGDTERVPLQGESLQVPVAVYNFQTTTGNYFANGILVHNCDLFARHVWLVKRSDELRTRLEAEPDYYDAKIA